MEIFESPFFQATKEWIVALAVLSSTLALVPALEALLKRSRWIRSSSVLIDLLPASTALLYPIGFSLFASTAPLNAKFEHWVDNGIYVLFVVLLLQLIRRAAMMGIHWSSLKHNSASRQLQQGFIPLLKNIVTLFVILTGGIMILKHFNYDVMSLITALGVGSLAVGLAAKDTLANMISGFTLIIDRNLRPGDRINLGGSIGEVEEIGLRSTRLKIGDGTTLIVPNGELVNTKILNLSQPTVERTCSTRIRIPMSVEFVRVKAICEEVLAQVAKANRERSTWVQLSSVFDGYQVVTVGFWLRHMDDQGEALSDFHDKLLKRLKTEGISLVSDPLVSIAPR